MKSYQNILVGINYTDASRHALKMAGRIALESGAKVTAFHVVPIAELNEFVSFYMIEHKAMMRAARSSLEDFVESELGNDHHVECRVGEGIPHHELVSQANEGGHDLLVLGDDDYAENPVDAGQFAIKCLRFAQMPVLLVNGAQTTIQGTISACLDFSASTEPVLENAARMATGHELTIKLVHACRPPWLRPGRLRYQTEVIVNQDQEQQFREILDGQLDGITKSAAPMFSAPVEPVRLEHEDTTTALLEYFETTPSDLIVIGRCGKGIKGLLTDLMGGTAEALIRHANCPVLIVPVTK